MTRIILPSSPLYRLSALHACQRLRMQVRLHNLSPAWTCTTCVNVPQGDWESPGPLTKWRLPGPMHGIKMGVEDISQRLQTSICHNASSFQWSHCFPCSGRVSLGVTGGNRLAAVSWSSLLTITRFYKLDVTSNLWALLILSSVWAPQWTCPTQGGLAVSHRNKLVWQYGSLHIP